MNKDLLFVNFHAHSGYSVQDALNKTINIVDSAKKLGHCSTCISEHGHLTSMPMFIRECEKAGINPRIAVEFYFQWESSKKDKSSYHLLVIVKDEIGYKNMLQLQYLSNIPVDLGGGFYIRPRITEKMLEKHKEGLIISSACINSPITSLLLKDQWMNAVIVTEYFKDNFKDFVIEAMPSRLDLQHKVNPLIFKLGETTGVRVITSLDVHIKDETYADAYLANGDIRRNRTIDFRSDPNADCLRDPDFWFKGPEEIIHVYDRHGIPKNKVIESFKNTLEIDKLITFTWKERHFESPKFCEDADRELYQILARKLVEKFGSRANIPAEYKDRIRYEFDIITRMGFANYFLILHDAIDFTSSKGIIVGPGRGSAGGSLMAYVLGITKIDPITYGLPFERFLNPERTNTSPDIDVDLEPAGREILIEYLKQRWGDTSVVQVANHSEVKVKAALKDAGKWLNIDFGTMNKITAAIPAKGWDDDGDPIDMSLEEALKLPAVQKLKKEHTRLFDIAEKLEGSFRQFGIHAGAVCILPQPAEEIIPVMKKKNDTGADVMVSQWDKNGLESVGIHKYDFLGLSTLSILAACEYLTNVKTENIPLEDKKTWKYLQDANHMLGIFQFIQDKTKRVLREVKPTNLNELADINTLIRPGADLDTYLKNKKARKIKYEFDIPEVVAELKNSYGSVIYQENIMNLCNTLGGFTLGEGDLVRRALEKNDSKKIADYRERFISNCKYTSIAGDLFDYIGANANYLFNKSHALVYSLIGYWCAFYKANYPEAFYIANINHPKSGAKLSESEYIAQFVLEAREVGVNIDLPKLGSAPIITSLSGGVIRYGLIGVRGISARSAEVLSSIVADNFRDYVDAVMAVKNEFIIRGKQSFRSVCNKSHILALCKIGFFGDTKKAIENFNEYFKTAEDIEIDSDLAINEAVGFEWCSPLLKVYNKLDSTYRNEDLYKLIQVTQTKSGGDIRRWFMIKGTTPTGEVTGFMNNGDSLVKKGDIIIAKYRKGNKGDAISIDAYRLVE